MGFQRGDATDLRCAGSRRIHRIQPVDIEAHISRAVADHSSCFLDGCFDAEFVELLHVNHAHATVVAELPLGSIVETAANTDLDGAFRVQQPFFDCASEGGAMVELGAQVVVAGITMSVEVNHADALLSRNGSEYGKCDRVITTRCNRYHVGIVQTCKARLDLIETGLQGERALYPRITDISDPRQLMR